MIVITSRDRPGDRVAGLEAGADDFLVKPFEKTALLTRLKSLLRLKLLMDELTRRWQIDLGGGSGRPEPVVVEGDSVLLVEEAASTIELVRQTLGRSGVVDVENDLPAALRRAAERDYDLAIISLNLRESDGLQLCSQLRSLDRTRLLPILAIVDPVSSERLLRGLDLGVDDYLLRPLDRDELLARAKIQVRRKRFTDRLRDSVDLTMEMAIIDGLTGLHNRRYLERHLDVLIRRAIARRTPLSLLILDIDNLKAVNDTHGQDIGDNVLREFSDRVLRAIRGIDLAGRIGGEEFVVALPDMDKTLAIQVGEKIRQRIAKETFKVSGNLNLSLTVSIGVSTLMPVGDTPQSLLKRADDALHRAKQDGRIGLQPKLRAMT